MPDLLALDSDSHQLSGFDAGVSKGSVRLRKSFTLQVPGDAELIGHPATPGAPPPKISEVERAQKFGEWLRGELREMRISTKQVLICLPREDTVVRQLEVPGDIPDNELPDVVRLQAETKISSSLDQLRLDFLPLPKIGDAPTRDVLMATISTEAADRLENSLKAADLEPVSMGLSSVAAMELVTRAENNHGLPPEGPSLVLARHGNRLEISLMRHKQLVFTHAAQIGGRVPGLRFGL
ncbi:MAG: pilus assembly protein PilM [Planctomycetaceae bacterium]